MGSEGAVLRGPVTDAPMALVLDASQRAVVEHEGPLLRALGGARHRAVDVAVEVVAQRVEAVTADGCLLPAPTRRAAAACATLSPRGSAARRPPPCRTQPVARLRHPA